ncbi:MAG: histidine--tRNA ligase [Aeriscardovia sp.]|nr:histidine--tRNA ligase [Aeriscardovia sp.]
MPTSYSISGFPEWSPEQRIVEKRVLEKIEDSFRLYGFINIETCGVESYESLMKKGDGKEIYRLAKAGSGEENLGLHFDLTLPLARYVLERRGELVFPFRRFQIQKVWRGERPQGGRYREFYQADIDIVSQGELPKHFEYEVPLAMCHTLKSLSPLGLGNFTMHINNRKLSEGFYRALGIKDVEETLRRIDKLDKLGVQKTRQILEEVAGERGAEACLDLAQIKETDPRRLGERLKDLCKKWNVEGPSEETDLMWEGAKDAEAVLSSLVRSGFEGACIDCAIARGLDYYTGCVYETFLQEAPSLGSICSGGRYENLISTPKQKYPGVGMSIGVSRLLSHLFSKARADRVSPAVALVTVWSEEEREKSDEVARILRERGIACEVSPSASKLGAQIKRADRLSIPYVWFVSDEGEEVKDIRTGDQKKADPAFWEPDPKYAADIIVRE